MAAAIPPKVSKWFDVLVSVAAAVVIFGALMKITHNTYADTWLYLGLTTESIIFLGYGLLYLRYPAIDDHQVNVAGATTFGNPALKSMEKLLGEADITPTNLSKLGTGIQKLNTTVDKMTEITDVVSATETIRKKQKKLPRRWAQ
jgi:hypothetical protein